MALSARFRLYGTASLHLFLVSLNPTPGRQFYVFHQPKVLRPVILFANFITSISFCLDPILSSLAKFRRFSTSCDSLSISVLISFKNSL